MISAVIQDDEQSVGPLADGEVARLLSVLNNAEFTRSDKHDLAKNSSFRQRSLIEIAAEAEKRKEAIETHHQNLESETDCDNTKVKNFSDAQPDSFNEKNSEAVNTNEPVPEQTIRDIASKEKIDDETVEPEVGIRTLTTNSTSISETEGKEPGIRGLTTNSSTMLETDGTEPGIRSLTTNSTSISEPDGTEPGIRGLTSVVHEETDISENAETPSDLTSSLIELEEQSAKNSFETVNEAYERGKTEGISEGKLRAIAEAKEKANADAKAELSDIVDTFSSVLDSLASPKAMQVEALSSSIETTILKLASARAGIQIDALPEAFYNRINALATGVAQELAEGKLHLNEDDYATMKPYLEKLAFEVVVNSNLMRGDVRLQFDGVEVHDVAANRIASNSAVNSETTATDNTTATDDTVTTDNITTADSAGLEDTLKGAELLPPSDEPDS